LFFLNKQINILSKSDISLSWANLDRRAVVMGDFGRVFARRRNPEELPLRFLTRISSHMNLHGGKGWPARKADNITAISRKCLENVGASTSHNPMGLHGLLQG
jgi:hypothetical protein